MISLHDMTPEPGRPLYLAVKDAVLRAIDAGRLSPGGRLPSTKALAATLEVSLVTVHRAMQELVDDGVLRRGQGKGTFVHESYGTRGKPGLGRRFGVVFHAECSLADAYHGQVFEGVRQGANDLGVDLVLLRFGEDWKNECHGYLFVNPFESELARWSRAGAPRMGSARRGEIDPPVMVLGASFSMPGVHSVDTDNVDLARRAVAHLASLGHRRIGFVGGEGRVSNDRDRHRGYTQACHDLGLEADPVALELRNASWRLDEPGKAALSAMLLGSARPTAIFAAGYYFALDVYSAANAVGMRIPEDLSIIGVDDPPSAAYLSPALTTFRQPLQAMGVEAVRRLLEESHASAEPGTSKPGAGTQSSLPADFIERGSCRGLRIASRGPTKQNLREGGREGVREPVPGSIVIGEGVPGEVVLPMGGASIGASPAKVGMGEDATATSSGHVETSRGAAPSGRGVRRDAGGE